MKLSALGKIYLFFLPALLIIFGKSSPLKFISHMFSAVATAFSTASSAATLPITIDCLEKKAGVSNKVASFVPALKSEYDGALPMGLHLEGPYLNPERKGAFNPAWLRQPDLDEAVALIRAGLA